MFWLGEGGAYQAIQKTIEIVVPNTTPPPAPTGWTPENIIALIGTATALLTALWQILGPKSSKPTTLMKRMVGKGTGDGNIQE